MADHSRSAFGKYQDLVIGSRSIWFLIKFELIILLFGRLPGALGLLLRQIFYPFILGRVGNNVTFGSNITLRHPHKIQIGENTVLDDNLLLDAKGESNKGILLGSNIFIGRNSILSCKNGNIQIGNGSNIGFNCEIFSSSQVVLDNNTLIAAYTYLIGGDHDMSNESLDVVEQKFVSKGILVGSNVWFGAGVIVLDGVQIEDNVIIGAGAVVRENISKNSVAVGVPARVIRER